jgi:predicted DNA-binding transcriptional regulator YafY
MKGTAWYLVAWCLRDGKYKTYRTDRISNVSLAGSQFQPRSDFRLAEFVEDSPGIWTPMALDARIEVLPSHVVALRSEACAQGYKFQPKGTGGLIEIARGNLDETAWWLARFGEGIRVLSPSRLRDRLLKIAQTILTLHSMNKRVQPSTDPEHR